MKKVGLIGCGYMGSMHADCYEAMSDRVQIVAVADLVEENAMKFSKRFNAKIYIDANDLILNADVDYVDICLPTYLHAEYAIMAMEKGLDAFVEKPLCLTAEEADKLVSVQEKTGRIVQVGQVIRFWDEYVWLKEAKESGKYGKLIFANFKRLSPYPTWAWNNWLHDASLSGGMAQDLHIHDADFARYLMGNPTEVKSGGVIDSDGLTDSITAVLKFDTASVTVEGSWSFPASFPFSMSFVARFEKAVVYHNSATGEFILYPNDGNAENITVNKVYTASSSSGGNVSSLGGYYNELKYFLDRLDNPSLPDIASVAEGAESLKLVLKEIDMLK